MTFLTNTLPTTTELFSELFFSKRKALTPYKAWYSTPYGTFKALKIIRSNAYIYLEGLELRKAGKIGARSKKIILIKYKDLSIYRLYDKKADAVILFCSVDINESLLLLLIITELVNNDLLIKPDKDESSDALIIGNTIHIIPRDKTTILDPILRVPRVIGVVEVIINKKDELENPPSRSRIPKIKRSRPKQQPIIDSAVLLT
jgi:hypothetical protein